MPLPQFRKAPFYDLLIKPLKQSGLEGQIPTPSSQWAQNIQGGLDATQYPMLAQVLASANPIAIAVYLPDVDYMTEKELYSEAEIQAVRDQTDPDIQHFWVVIVEGNALKVTLKP